MAGINDTTCDATRSKLNNGTYGFKLDQLEVYEIIFSLLDVLGHAKQNDNLWNETIDIILRCAKYETTFVIKSILSFLEVSQIDSTHQTSLLVLLRKILSTHNQCLKLPLAADLKNVILNCHSFMMKELYFITTADTRHVEIKLLMFQIGHLCPKECLDYVVSALKKNLIHDISANSANKISISLSLMDSICKHSPKFITVELLLLFVPLIKYTAIKQRYKSETLVKESVSILHNLFTYKDIRPFNTKSIDFNLSLYDTPYYPRQCPFNSPGISSRCQAVNANTNPGTGICKTANDTDSCFSHKGHSISPFSALLTTDGYQSLEPLLITLITECIPHIFTPELDNCDDSICKALHISSIIATHVSDAVWKQYIPQICSAIIVRKDMYSIDAEHQGTFLPVKTLGCQIEWVDRGNVRLKRDKKLFPQLISSIISKNRAIVTDALKNALINISLRPYPPLYPHILACSTDLRGDWLNKFYLFSSKGVACTLNFLENQIAASEGDVIRLEILVCPLITLMKAWSGLGNSYINYGIDRLVTLVDKQVGKITSIAFNYDLIIAGDDKNPIPWGSKLLKQLLLATSAYKLSRHPISIASYLIVHSFDLQNLIVSNAALFKKASIITGFDRIPGINLIPLAKCIQNIRLPKFAYPFLLSHLYISNKSSLSKYNIAMCSINIAIKSLNLSISDLPISPNKINFSNPSPMDTFRLTEFFMKHVGVKNPKELLFPIKWFNNKIMRTPLLYITILTSDKLAMAIILNLLSSDNSETNEFNFFKDVLDDLIDASDSELIPIAAILAYKSSFGSGCDRYFQMLLDMSNRKTSSFSIFTTSHMGKKNDFIRRLSIIALSLVCDDLQVEENGFVTITKTDRVWRYFLDELLCEEVSCVKRAILFGISQFLNKEVLITPNFPHIESIYEFPHEAAQIVSQLIFLGLKINLAPVIAKLIHLIPESEYIVKIFDYINNVDICRLEDDNITEITCEIVYETIINGYDINLLSKYPIIVNNYLYKVLSNQMPELHTQKITIWHVNVSTRLALTNNQFSSTFLENLLILLTSFKSLTDCSDSIAYIVSLMENEITDDTRASVRKIIDKLITIPKALHYIYTLSNLPVELKKIVISLTDYKSLKKLIKWENELVYVQKTDYAIAKILLSKCVCESGVFLLAKSIDKLTNNWLEIFNNYASKYPNKLSIQLAKLKKSQLLYYLHKKVYCKHNIKWIMYFSGDLIDKYLARTLSLVVDRVSLVKVYPICKTIAKITLNTLQAGHCFAELLKLCWTLLRIKHHFTFMLVTKFLTTISQLLDQHALLLSSKIGIKMIKSLLFRILSLSKYQVDHLIHSVPFLKIFVKLGTSGGKWKSIIRKLHTKLLKTDKDELKLTLVTYLQSFFIGDCWDFGAVDDQEMKGELQLVISQQRNQRVTQVFYKFDDEQEINDDSKTNNNVDDSTTLPLNQPGFDVYKFKHKISLAMLHKIQCKNGGLFIKKIQANAQFRKIIKYVDKEIEQLETVPSLSIPENNCPSNKLHTLNLINFFTTLSSGYDRRYAYDTSQSKVSSMIFCAELLTKMENSNSVVINSLNIAVCKQICQATKSDDVSLQMDGIRAIGKFVKD